MTNLTPKQEHFCQKYIETGNASEAYRQAYKVRPSTKEETVWQAASRLLNDAKVSPRLDELRAEHRKRHDVTVEALSDKLEDVYVKAMDSEGSSGLSAANSAVLGQAKLHGLLPGNKVVMPEGLTFERIHMELYGTLPEE
jgi:phage terminase small subunit